MSNWKQRKKTMCDVCRWKMQCKEDGIVDLVGEKGKKYFWLKNGHICPIDEQAEYRKSI